MPEKVLCIVTFTTTCSPCTVQRRCMETPSLATQLILRSINTARSAFVAITFRNEYFDAFDVYDTVIVQAGVLIKVASGATDRACRSALLPLE